VSLLLVVQYMVLENVLYQSYPPAFGNLESEYSRMDSQKKRNPSAGGGISEPSSGDGILECDLGEM
jgi:hypothetical protein